MLEALLAPWTAVGSRTWWGGLLVFVLVTFVVWLWKRPAWNLRSALANPTHLLDVQLLLGRQALGLLLQGGGAGLALRIGVGVVTLLQVLGRPELSTGWWTPLLYSVTLFVVWDFSRWVTHWALHRFDTLWAFHQIHHSAEVLTPLTFHRVHPFESVVYTLRGALSTGGVAGLFFWLHGESIDPLMLLGVPAAGLVLSVLFGNLRHSHVWVPFPPAVERWFLSPAQHQIHHALGRELENYGTWLAVWDRMAGSLSLSDAPPERYGVADRNHGNDLLSAWFGPFRSLLPLAALLLVSTAQAEGVDETEEEPTEQPAEELDDEAGMSIVVTDEDGTPRVAGSAHVVDEETLEAFEYNDIGRAVAGVPGMSSRGEDGYGLRPNLGIRGANSDRSAKLTLMEDGVLLAPAPYAAPAAYYFPMTTRMVGIEVFKGPAATRHGPQTVAGAVNLRTRAVPRGFAYGVDLAGGTRQTGKLHAHAGYGGRTAGVLVEGVHLRTAGFKELDTGGPTGFDRTEVMVKSYWRPSPDHRLQLKLGYANETSNETYLGLSALDYEDNPYRRYAASSLGLMDWTRTQAELQWTGQLGPWWTVRSVAYHHYLDRSWTKLNRFGDGGPDLHSLMQSSGAGQSGVYLAVLRGDEDSLGDAQNLMVGDNHRTFHSAGWQTTLRGTRYGENVNHQLELGLRLHQDKVWRVHTEDAYAMRKGELAALGQPTETTLDSVAAARALAVHAHDEMTWGRLAVLPGLRTEVVQTERSDVGVDVLGPVTRVTLLPGAGALYSLTPWVHGFVGAHRGFSPVAPGQPEDVRPEISWNYEAGVRVDEGDRRIELVGFFNDYSNLTGQCTLSGGCVGDSVDRQFNGGDVHIWGVESVAGRTLRPGAFTIPIELSYALTQSRFQTGFVSAFPQFGTVEAGDHLPYVPTHQAAARTGLQHDRFALNLGVTWRSALLDQAGLPGGDTDLPDLLLIDASASLQVRPHVAVYGTGTNLAGNDAMVSWRPYGARPTAPRQVMVGVKVR